MFDTIPLAPRALRGLIALVLLAGLAAVGLRSATGAFSDAYTLRATFDRTGHNLDASSNVKIRGVTVGSVASIRLLPDGRSLVAMHIRRGVRVADTTSAAVEPLSIFGPQFVQLDPGAHEISGPFLPAGATITATTPPTELTDVLSRVAPLLQAIRPDDLLTVVHNLATGLDGLGPVLGSTVDNAAQIVGLLDRRSSDTAVLLADLARLSSAVADKGQAAVATARALNDVLPLIANHPDQVGQLLDDASRVAGDLAGLVNQHAPALEQILAGLGTAVGAIYQQLAAFPAFVQSIDGFFYTLGRALLRLPGPAGHVIGVLEGTEPADLCLMFTGLPCPRAG